MRQPFAAIPSRADKRVKWAPDAMAQSGNGFHSRGSSLDFSNGHSNGHSARPNGHANGHSNGNGAYANGNGHHKAHYPGTTLALSAEPLSHP